jgi:hypothetical protein
MPRESESQLIAEVFVLDAIDSYAIAASRDNVLKHSGVIVELAKYNEGGAIVGTIYCFNFERGRCNAK